MTAAVSPSVLEVADRTLARRLRPQKRMLPSEWAERHRVLPREQTSRPGPWRNETTPYLVGIMDEAANPRTEEIVVKKAAQAGVSEGIRNVIGWIATREPDPFLYVMPTEGVAKKIVRKRLRPLFESTPVLRDLYTGRVHDVSNLDMTLANGFNLTPAWAGSPSALASDPRRYVFNDEVDKYPPWSGKEADPISLAYVRTQSYEDRRLTWLVSTPTTRLGTVHRAYERCAVKLEYYVPCPHCGVFAVLKMTQVKVPQIDEPDPEIRAGLVKARQCAWYECEHCQGKIDELAKPAMVRRGVWATKEQSIRSDGTVEGDRPEGVSVGFHLSCLPVLWISFSDVAAQQIRCAGDPEKVQDFRNAWLGEVFETRVSSTKKSAFREKMRTAPPPGIVPSWAALLIAGADTQKDHFWYVLRAFGHLIEEGRMVRRSQLVLHGRCETFDDLRRICFESRYPIEGSEESDVAATSAALLAIDSGGGVKTGTGGNRTHDVYDFALTDVARIWAIKGWGGHTAPKQPVTTSRIDYAPASIGGRTKVKVELRLIDTNAFKDQIASDIRVSPGGDREFLVHSGIDAAYIEQMTSEHKVTVFDRGNSRERWVPIATGAANHLWDAETYARGVAEYHQAFNARTFAERASAASFRRQRPAKSKKRLTTPDGRPFLVTDR